MNFKLLSPWRFFSLYSRVSYVGHKVLPFAWGLLFFKT
jgi:hypothetical protein